MTHFRSLFMLTFILLTLSFSIHAQTATHKTPFDYDGDNKTDHAVWRPSDGSWYILQSSNNTLRSENFGLSTDRIVPGDYDGDGKTDIAVFRLLEGTWYVLKSSNGAIIQQQWGASGDLPVAGDYDGDGKTDYAVFRPADNTWHIRRSLDGSFTSRQFGGLGDIPVRGDFDGDGKAEIAVWRPSTGTWFYVRSTDNEIVAQQWGLGSLGDTVGTGDYDGDGKTDLAVWRSSTGTWYVLKSSDGQSLAQVYGSGPNGDVPVPGNYDGDTKTDYAVWRVPTGTWYALRSSDSTSTSRQWGSQALGDKLAPAAFIATGAIAGTVTDARTGNPINGALIEVFDQGAFKISAASGITGYYSATGLLDGKYEVRVTANGHKDARLTGVNAVAGGTTTANAALAGQTVLAEDDFNNNSLSGLWQIGLIGANGDSSIGVAAVNQRLEITVPPASANSNSIYNGVRSTTTYDLRDAYATVRVVKIPKENDSVAFNSESLFEIGPDSNNKLQFVFGTDGRAFMRMVTVPQQTFEFGSFYYSTTTMAYVRIRFKPNSSNPAQSQIYFETSPSGADGTWTIRNTANSIFNNFSLSNVRVSLNAGSYGAVAIPATAIFDDFKFAKTETATANAGEDKVETLGAALPALDGSGSTGTGSLTYKWTLTSKPSGAPDPSITSPNSAVTGITGLTFIGYYNFQLTVTDGLNSTSTDSVRLAIVESPVARIVAPSSIIEDEPIVFDGSLSSGAYEVRWQFGDGREAEIHRATHLYMTPNADYTVTLTVTNEAGLSNTTTTTVHVNAPAAPTTTTTLPPCDANARQNLVNAINGATGRTDIILRAGCDYGGNDYNPIMLPNKSGSDYIVLRSESLSALPPKGARISEDDIANMPIISTPRLVGEAAIKTEDGAHHYRFVGILFRRNPVFTGFIYNLIALTYGEPVIENVPHHLIFDRCIFSNIPLGPDNPNPPTDREMRRGIQMNSGSTSVINSYFRELKEGGQDSQSISCWGGIGPHAIINNFLEGAGENILYGGEKMRIPYATPSDITIRGNYFFKPTSWATDPLAKVKNIFELKHAWNVILDGNVLQNSYPRAQMGDAIVMQVGNESYVGFENTGENPWATIRNVQITNNKIDNVGAGITLKSLTFDVPSVIARNIIIRNNLLDRVGATNPSEGFFIKVNGHPGKLWVTHNTVFQEGTSLLGSGGPLLTNDSEFRFDNNVLKHNLYGFTGQSFVADGLRYLNTYAPGWQMRRNVMVFPDEKTGAIANYPSPANITNSPVCPVPVIDLKLNKYFGNGTASYSSLFLNQARGDYRLSQASYGGYQWATDCTDVGVNLNTLQAATAGARAGLWNLPGQTILLADDFNDAARDTLVWAEGTVYGNNSSVTLNEQNKRLEITVPAGSGEIWNGFDAIYPLDFTGAQASVKVPQVVSNAGGETWLFVYLDSANFFRIGVRRDSGGNFALLADKVSGGNYQKLLDTNYNSNTHRWWRIRHQASDDTMKFETSLDGIVWSTQASTGNSVNPNGLRVSLGAGKTNIGAASPSTAFFDNLKVSR